MKNEKILFALLVGVSTVAGLRADTIYSTSEAGMSTDQLTNSKYWGDAGADPWPNPANDYVLRHGVRGPDAQMTFNGRSFQIGELNGTGAWIAAKEASSVTYANEGLVLAKGSYKHWSQNKERWINGKVTVISPEATPFVFTCDHQNSSNGHALGGPLYGESGVALKMMACSKTPGYRFRLAGDLSHYFGKIWIDSDVQFTCGYDSNDTGARTCPGRIQMGLRTALILPCTNSSLTVSTISFGVGSALHVHPGHDGDEPVCSSLTVTQSLSLPSEGKLKIALLETLPLIRRGRDAPKYEVLRVAKSVKAISLDNFELDSAKVQGYAGNLFLPRDAQLMLDETEDGVQVLSVQPRKIVHLVTSDGTGGTTSFLPSWASHWYGMTDGTPLSPEVDYFMEGGYIRTPEASTNPDDWTFKGHSLTIDKSHVALKGAYPTVFPDLVMRTGAGLQNWGAGVKTAECPGGLATVDGKLTTVYRTKLGAWEHVLLNAPQNRGIHLKAELCGDSPIMLEANTANNKTKASLAEAEKPYFEFSGINTNFHGVICFGADETYPDASAELKISDGRNLGGAMWSGVWCPYGVWVRNGTVLHATKSLTISEPTRGIWAHGWLKDTLEMKSVFRTDKGVTMTIDGAPLSLKGRLWKDGEGTLALGGTLILLDEDKKALETPIEGQNLIHVEEGRLQALSTGAFSKAKISFGDKGAISVGLPKAGGDATFAKYGADLTFLAEPFGSAVVPVTVEGDAAAFGEGTVAVPVFTVKKSATATFSVRGVKPAKGYRVIVEMRENAGEETVTCWATVAKTGLAVLIK